MFPSPFRICFLRFSAFFPFLYPLKGNPNALSAAPGIDSSSNGPVLVLLFNGGIRQPDRHKSSSICIPRNVIGTMLGLALWRQE